MSSDSNDNETLTGSSSGGTWTDVGHDHAKSMETATLNYGGVSTLAYSDSTSTSEKTSLNVSGSFSDGGSFSYGSDESDSTSASDSRVAGSDGSSSGTSSEDDTETGKSLSRKGRFA